MVRVRISRTRVCLVSILTFLFIIMVLPNMGLASASSSASSSPMSVPISGFDVPGPHSTDAQCPQLSANMFAISSNLNEQTAANFVKAELDMNSVPYGVTNSWEVGADCSFTWVSVNLAYYTSSAQAVLVSVNPALTEILAINSYPLMYANVNNPSWAGYEYHPSSALATARADWNEPSASQGDVSCEFTNCDVLTWVGLSAESGGGSGSGKGIAQTGTDSGVYCTIGCQTYYWTFTEFFPAALVMCPHGSNNNIKAGDQIFAQSYTNDSNGNPTNNYYLYLHDDTNGVTCTATQSNWSIGDAYYAQFILERLNSEVIPKWSTLTFSPGAYCTNSKTSCTTIGTNYINEYVMVNGGNTNAQPGSVSNGDFSVPYSTSKGT